MNLRKQLLNALVPELGIAQAQLAAISARVDDSPGWESMGQHPGDVPYADRYLNLQDVHTAWRKNTYIRRLVFLTRGYVVGGGMAFSSENPDVQAFLSIFWNHRKNKLDRRLASICDQLTKDGELFPILFTNPATGISYVRFRTAQQITEIRTTTEDWETELAYIQNTTDPTRPRIWYSPEHRLAQQRSSGGALKAVMLHWTVNKPIDALRGEGDLTPILPWARRYNEWLLDRLRINRQRTRQGMMDVEIADATQVEKRRRALEQHNPTRSGIYVHSDGEKVTYPDLRINADDAAADGKAMRLAIATGSNTAPHYLAEGESINYATAKEMGEPTTLFYAERQKDLSLMMQNLIETAYGRYVLHQSGHLLPDNFDFQIAVTIAKIARAERLVLAQAANEVAQAFAIATENGWADGKTALKTLMKFVGETLSEQELETVFAQARAEATL